MDMGALCLHMFLARLCSFLCPEENYLALNDAAMDLPIPDDPPVTIAVRVLVLIFLPAACIARTPKPPHNRLHIPSHLHPFRSGEMCVPAELMN